MEPIEYFLMHLREYMESRQLNSADLGKKLGISTNTIGRYFRRERVPSMEMLVILAREMDVSIDWLLGVGKQSQNTSNVEYLYNIATPADRKVIDTILEKYKEAPEDADSDSDD